MKFRLSSGGRRFEVEVSAQEENLEVSLGERKYSVKLERGSDELFAHVDGRKLKVEVEEETETSLKLRIGGELLALGRAQAQLQSGAAMPTEEPLQSSSGESLESPLYGRVVSVDVKEGDTAEQGQALLVVEAMKMEMVIRAEARRKVSQVLVKVGESVKKGQLLMKFSDGSSA